MEELQYQGSSQATVTELKVKPGGLLRPGGLLLSFKDKQGKVGKMRSTNVGKVTELLVKVGDVLTPKKAVIRFSPGCPHPTVMKDMCAECGADLRKEDTGAVMGGAGVAMVHAIPELRVSKSEAATLGREDLSRLVADRKLVLLVDLDQTLIHTTNDQIPANMKDVYHFQLYGPSSPWYHTRIRPGTQEFLENISKLYELHICTFGARLYAHQIAKFLDPGGKFFSHRILSRDECFDPRSKTANMSALFPCGDSMVCIVFEEMYCGHYSPRFV